MYYSLKFYVGLINQTGKNKAALVVKTSLWKTGTTKPVKTKFLLQNK